MPEKTLPPFDPFRFIPNLVGGKKSLELLIDLLEGHKDNKPVNPVLINVFIQENSNSIESQETLGGFGKSLVIREAADFLGRGTQELIPKIDLAVRYTTKKDILWQVGKKLGFPENMYLWLKEDYPEEWSKEDAVTKGLGEWSQVERKKYGELYSDIFVDINNKNQPDYDPSYIAEKLFAKVALAKPPETSWQTPILFFDSFDYQYLGDNHAPLRKWLRDDLFPFLVNELKVSVFVSGREKLEDQAHKYKERGVAFHEFQLQAFNEDQCKQYFLGYAERRRRHELKKGNWYPAELKDAAKTELQIAENAIAKWNHLLEKGTPKDVWQAIKEKTNGKPIILDFLADLVYRECTIKETAFSIQEVLDNSDVKGIGKTSQERFEMYLIDHLNNHSLNSTDIKYRGYFIVDALVYLTIARHGMEAKDLVQVRDRIPPDEITYDLLGNEIVTSQVPQEDIDDVQAFFDNVFHEEYLSFVKNVRDAAKSTKQDRRLLHDEVVLLYRKYYFGTFDPNHEARNFNLQLICALYKAQMHRITRNHDRYSRLLLEYMEYRFDFKGKDKERATINFFLYEFSYYLNRYADLNSRFIQIARTYYRKKELAYLNGEEDIDSDTILFSDQFNLLSKILLRENHYHLTTRAKGWESRIFSDSAPLMNGKPPKPPIKDGENPPPILDDIYNTQNRQLLEERDYIGLRARGLSATGEAKIWLTQWDEAREELEKSKEFFYRTGESHGLAWVEHLLGFEAQRVGRFEQAEMHHRDALETAFFFSQRLINEARKEKKENPDDWHHRYRLRYLAELSNRANGNLALRLRYQGRLLEALKTLNANLILAKISGIREQVRNDSNRIQFSTVIGRDNEYNQLMPKVNRVLPGLGDPLLRRRIPNTELIHLTKTIGLESRVYRKRVDSYTALKSWNIAKVSQQKSRIDLFSRALGMALQSPPTPLKRHGKSDPWNALLPLSDPDNPIRTQSTNREIADMYYQFGKLVLTTQYIPSGLEDLEYFQSIKTRYTRLGKADHAFFEVAKIAYENAYETAKKATFLYLQMEAAESLYRLTYLSQEHRKYRIEYRGLYRSAEAIMKSTPEKYGVYHDLLSRFHVTEADFMLEELIQNQHLIPEMFRPPLEHLAMALWHGYCHNQERYMLILNVFTNRMRGILMHLHKAGLEDEFAEYFLEDILSTTEIYRDDPNFHVYLSHFLRALKMEIEKEIVWRQYSKVKLGIAGLMGHGKFVKAADVNACLIRLLRESLKKNAADRPNVPSEQDKKIKLQLALRCFQQVYSFLGANRWRRADDLLRDACDYYQGDDRFVFDKKEAGKHQAFHFETLEAAILGLAKGITTYRTSDYWNLEIFILGELTAHREKHAAGLEEAERYLTGVLRAFGNFVLKDSMSQENKPLMRLASETLFRLGELYLLLELGIDDRAVIQRWTKRFVASQIKRLLLEKGMGPFREEFDHGYRYDDSPAILMFNCAYYLAILVNDHYRAANSLQSIANARYLRGETRKANGSDILGRMNIIQNLHEGVLALTREKPEKGLEKIIFKVVEAKLWLVEGDVYFSELFIYVEKDKGEDEGEDEEPSFELRTADFPEEDIRQKSKIKGILHEMMWRYLTALDLLTDNKNQYDSYHFQNMAFEINRRMMHITDPELVQYVMEDLHSVWNIFPNLRTKDRIIRSLEHDLKTHALALSIQEILDETPPAP